VAKSQSSTTMDFRSGSDSICACTIGTIIVLKTRMFWSVIVSLYSTQIVGADHTEFMMSMGGTRSIFQV
jgi:hypothetical protein